ncbi:hypothetical protein Pfo_002916 [Paulownia fortunei]|nr:hypothetical protein Pfo_002916 [Paulownia fortunei]
MLPRSRTLPARIYDDIVEERHDIRHYLQVEVQLKAQNTESKEINLQANYSKCFDDNGRLKRTGTFWTATSHIISSLIASMRAFFAWAVGQLGWVAGPAVMTLFAFVYLYTSNLPSKCCSSGVPVTRHRNYTYMDAVKANLGGLKVNICWLIQYINLFGAAIGYTIAASDSMLAIKQSNCFHKTHMNNNCNMSSNGYMITFGTIEILFSQIPDIDQVWWLSILAAVMSFTYSTIGLALGIAKVSGKHTYICKNKSFKGSLTGISIGTMRHSGLVTPTQKMWRSLQALGAIAFAYSHSINLREIQDTMKSPPAEQKIMKKATSISISVTTIFYLLWFGFFNPNWLLDIANIGIVVHLAGAYQVKILSIAATINAQRWSRSNFVTAEYDIPIPFYGVYQLSFFRLLWRTGFVVLTTFIAILLPFFEDVVGIFGALGFWPLTVYFPVEMYITQNKIGPCTNRWIGLQILSMASLFVSVAAAAGSVASLIFSLRIYKPFNY